MSIDNRTSKAKQRSRVSRSSQMPTTVATKSSSFVSSGAILLYDINERRCYPGQGNTVFDLTGNGRHMTLNGPTYSVGSSGGYINFDGVDDYGLIPYDAGLNLPKFSILAWVYLNANPDSFDAIFIRDYPPTINYYLDCGSSGFRFGWYADGAPSTTFKDVSSTTTTNSTVGSWRMVTGTFDGDQMQIFVNGAREALTTGNVWDNRASTAAIGVGALKINTTYQRFTNMRLGMMALYDRGLDLSEVNANFQATRSRFGVLM